MKLCPLFEKVMADSVYGEYEPEYRGAVLHCNDALPREAIVAAIDCMEMYGRHYSVDPYINEYIEQLRAML